MGLVRPVTVRALTAEQLPSAYQPIVDLTSGATFAHEALVRCRVETFASPIGLFDRAVEENACGQLGRTIRQGAFDESPKTAIFVNLHPHELIDRWLVRPDDPICFHEHAVYLEITESATLDYYDLCINVLKEVCARTGAHLVVDDLGAGYSNLTRVVDLEPSIVKLDRALVTGLDKNKRKRVLVRYLVEMCQELGARVVAEGIETLDELKAVRDVGTHFGQGFFLARPAFTAAAVKWPFQDEEE